VLGGLQLGGDGVASEDVDHAFEVVGHDREADFGLGAAETAQQEARMAEDAIFQGGEGMLNRRSSEPHDCQIMLEELERRNYAPGTIHAYLRTVEHFARHFRYPRDRLGPEHIRQYQAAMFRTWKAGSRTSASCRCL
jgi:Phage integrase, N-terminal SAM-like domain